MSEQDVGTGQVPAEDEGLLSAHLAGLEAALDDLADRLESLGREGASSTTAALTEVLALVRGLTPGTGALVTGLREDAAVLRTDLADALGVLASMLRPGQERLEQAVADVAEAARARDEQLADVLRGVATAVGDGLGRIAEQVGRVAAGELDLDALADRVAERLARGC